MFGDYGYVFLTASPRATHDYYFVQLERSVGDDTLPEPVSPVYTFDTYDGCEKNKILLTFYPRVE
jgi:hypothetical protein